MFKFCPSCAVPLPPVGEAKPATCGGCAKVWYRNSKPCVGAVIVRDGKVLLSRRARAPKAGAYDLPGGFLEWGEEPRVGLARELLEETGLLLWGAALLDIAVGEYGDERTLNLLYACRTEGDPVAASDSAALEWFPLDALPDLAFPHEARLLEALAEGRAEAAEPAGRAAVRKPRNSR